MSVNVSQLVNLSLIYCLIITGGNLSNVIEYTITGFLKGAVILGILVLAGYLVRKYNLKKYFG